MSRPSLVALATLAASALAYSSPASAQSQEQLEAAWSYAPAPILSLEECLVFHGFSNILGFESDMQCLDPNPDHGMPGVVIIYNTIPQCYVWEYYGDYCSTVQDMALE